LILFAIPCSCYFVAFNGPVTALTSSFGNVRSGGTDKFFLFSVQFGSGMKKESSTFNLNWKIDDFSKANIHAMPNDCRKPGGFHLLTLFIVLTLFSTTQLYSQTSLLHGKVVDSTSSEPVTDATVSVTGSATTVKTGKDGEFAINVAVGQTLAV